MASSSSLDSSSKYSPRWKYDVFLSFRGEDTRKTITGHLYEGLKNRGIITFQDDKRLELGDSIPQELLKAIEESQVSLVVFSKNYATSRWCLNELVKIMECKDKNGQIVIPIFYDVDATEVRNQSESFAVAIAEHEKKYKDDAEGMQKVRGWRTALTAAANLKGSVVFHGGVESDCIKDIIAKISSICKTSVSYLHKVEGVDTQLKKVESLLEMEVDDVRIVWIWGMGGIGKTTIAKTIFYNTLSSKFKDACFLEDIKENNHRIHSLQNILLSKLAGEKENCVDNKEEGKHLMARRLRLKKALVVLDDIDDRDQLDYLAGDLDWFGKGSRIMVTTRDKHLMGNNDILCEVTTLVEHQAIQLFNQYAFEGEVLDERFVELTLEVVSHAEGLPFALKVWGSFLRNRNINEWRSAIEDMRINSKSEIHEKLKISYDGLETAQQDIFLDIACFLRGKDKSYIMQILESCYSGADIRLRVLIDKSLVFIADYDTIQMHGIIQDMGKYIVELQTDPGERSRLWLAEDFEEVMFDNTGTKAMEPIWVEDIRDLCFTKKAMENMRRLRILHIEGTESHSDSIEYLPTSLRWFDCHEYPWKSLPENFEAKRLVHLNLRGSSLRHLWAGRKNLPCLRTLDLSSSRYLMRTPDFREMPNLEHLNLSRCKSLEEVDDTLGYCGKLIRLDLSYCDSLKRFPCVNLESLEYLNLWHCSSFEKFPEILGRMKPELHLDLSYCNLEELDLRGSNFEHLPPSIAQLAALRSLDLSYCKRLKELPDFTGMPNLETLNLSNCINLEKVHHSLGYCGKLIRLNLIYCKGLRRFPCVNVESLEYLDLKFCSRLEKFPEIRGSTKPNLEIKMCDSEIRELPSYTIQYLTLRHLENLVALPSSIGMLQGLVILDVSTCYKVESLPEEIGDLENLEKLDANYTLISRPPASIVHLNKLKFLSFAKQRYNISLKDGVCFLFPQVNEGLCSLEHLDLSYCNLIDGGLPEDIGSLSSLKELHLNGNNFEHLPQSISQLGGLQSLHLKECKRLKELPSFTGMQKLETLNLSIINIKHLPRSIAQLGALRYLDLSYCKRLKELPGFTGMPNLETLNLSNCMNLEEVHHSLGFLKKLRTLKLTNCKRLKRFPALCIDSLDYLCLRDCSSLEKIPEILGSMKVELEIHMQDSLIRALGFRGFENLATLPSSVCKLKSLVSLNVSDCSKLESFPEEIGDLENLERLDARDTLISQPPPSIFRLNKLEFLSFAKQNSGGGLVDGVCFVFPQVAKGLSSLEILNLSYCNLIDRGLPEDIGCLSTLKELYLTGNNFERLPQSIAQLGALRSLDLSDCKRLKELPGFMGMQHLETLNLSNCMNLDEVHHSLGLLKKLCTLELTNCKRLKRFVALSTDSLENLYLQGCSSLENFPEIQILGSMNLKLKSGIRCLDLRGLENLVTLPSSICKLKILVELNVSACSKLESLPKEIGDLENLEWLDAKDTLISQPPPSIVRLNKLHFLRFAKQKSEVGLKDGVYFVFPLVSDGLRLLEILNLSYCNLTDGGLPQDIGFLSSLNELYLCGNNFEHLPRSTAQLAALRSLDLSYCKRLKELPDFTGMPNLETLYLSNCMNLEEVHHSLGFLKKLYTLELTNCERIKRFPALCIDSLENLDLNGCSSLEKFPEIVGSMKVKSDIHMLDSVIRDLKSMCNTFPHTLYQNIASLQHDISASDYLSPRVFSIEHGGKKIPRWFHHQGMDKNVSVNLPENWYAPDKFLGFAVCYSGTLTEITVQLLPLCDDGMSWMTQKLKLYSYLPYGDAESTMHFFLVPLSSLWDTSKANGKTPNDYGLIRLSFSGEMTDYGCRLLYKDEAELKALLQMRGNNDEPTGHSTGTRTSRYDNSEHSDSITNEASCCQIL